MGSSAQITSGVHRCGSQAQVPEAGSGGFRKVLVCAGAGSGGRFRKVPEVPEAGFRRQGSGGRVPEGFGSCWRVPESSGVLAGGFRRAKGQAQVLEGFASL